MTHPRRRGRLRLVAIAGAMTAIVASGPAAARTAAVTTPAWPQFQGNAAHTGDEPAERSVTRQNVSQLTLAWTQPVVPCDCGIIEPSQVTVTGGTAYAIGAATVYAFNAITGTPVWQRTFGSSLLGTPSVQGGLVLVAYNGGTRLHPKGFVVALSSATGATVWSREVGPMNPPSLSQGTSVTTTANRAYVSLLSGQVDALGLTHGGILWTSPVLPGTNSHPSCILSPPSVSGKFAVVGTGGQVVTALDAATGAVAWSDTLGSSCGESVESWLPAISGGTVYAGWQNGLAAIGLASGSVLWNNASAGEAIFPLSVTAGDVIAAPIAGTGNQMLEAFSRTDGSRLWQSTTTRSEALASTFGGLTWALAANNAGTSATAFSAATGHRVYSSAPFSDDSDPMPPVVNAGRVYLDTGSELMCLALPGAAG